MPHHLDTQTTDTQPTASKPNTDLRVVILLSGTGSLAEALTRAALDTEYPATVVGVVSDKPDAPGLAKVEKLGVPTAVVPFRAGAERAAWDLDLANTVAAYEPDLVVLAGFMKIVGASFLERFGGRVVNTHPALCPSFPGADGVGDALDYGVKITGTTLFFVDEGTDTGPIIAQRPVAVEPADSRATLHERIKEQERDMLITSVAALAQHGWTTAGRKVTLP